MQRALHLTRSVSNLLSGWRRCQVFVLHSNSPYLLEKLLLRLNNAERGVWGGDAFKGVQWCYGVGFKVEHSSQISVNLIIMVYG